MSKIAGIARVCSRVVSLLLWCSAGLSLAGSALAQASPRVAFVTSAAGNGDLSSWPDAEGRVGLEAGDHVCRVLAAHAGLAGAQDFVAWLSDSADDAYCRVQGLAGQRADLCGQPVLPAAAGPWVRTDGLPFAAGLAPLLGQGEVFYPLVLDETGKPVSGAAVLTGSSGAGEVELSDSTACADWTVADDGFVTVGSVGASTVHWHTASASSCSTGGRRLLCLQAGTGGPLPPFEPLSERVAFVTAIAGNGNLGSWPQAGGEQGVAAGDAICRSRAASAGLAQAQSFKAWLAGSTPAADRFVHDGPWQRLDGVRLAGSVAELAGGALRSTLNVSDAGGYLTNSLVWTGTDGAGNPTGLDCQQWSSGSGSVQVSAGWANFTQFWSRIGERTCDNTGGHLYCLADVPAAATSSCTPGAGTLCLGVGGRFRVSVGFSTASGQAGDGRTVDIGRRDSGLFYFFDADNIEMLVKVLDGCAVNGSFWVFYAATTDVGFELTVEDLVAGTSRVYTNPVGLPAPPVLDTSAFATCSAGG